MRENRTLASPWQFQLDPTGELTVENLAPDREISVPAAWQAVFPELQQYSGYAWYRQAIELSEADLAGELLLHFGAVDYWCQVFFNEQLVGEHEGGYTAFSFAVRKHAQVGTNTIAVRVYDSCQTEITLPRWPTYQPDNKPSQPPFDANHVPHGKQEWYINVGGLWQTVTLTPVPLVYLDSVHVHTNIHTGEAFFKIELAGEVTKGSLTIDLAGKVGSTDVTLTEGQNVYEGTVKVSEPHWWNTDDPYLYTATVQLNGQDELQIRFGFREITTRNGQLWLNDQPLFLRSALDQDLYPDTIYTVPSEEFLRDQFRKTKELGLNNLRCHIKPPEPVYFDLADEMGLLIWAEIPSWRTFYPKGTYHQNQLHLEDNIKNRVEHLLVEMIKRDFNHPSIIIWTIVNEDWGTALPLSQADRTWVASMYKRCKELDPTRLVVDNSPCPHAWGPNLHVQSDLDDFHFYANIPDQAESFDAFLNSLSMRPLWSYSTHADTIRSGQEPIILSEFGNWGLPSVAALQKHYKGDPAWFELGPWWSGWDGEAGWPKGVLERFAGFGLAAIWHDYEAFAEATQWHQYAALKYQIEAMRCKPSLAGYVITELSDIYWESNGLLDFVRNPKVFHALFKTFNADDVLIVKPSNYAFWDDGQVELNFYASHFGSAAWQAVKMRGMLNGQAMSREHNVPTLERGEVKHFGKQRLALSSGTKCELDYTLYAEQAGVLARNKVSLLVLAAKDRQTSFKGQIAVITKSATDEQALFEVDMATAPTVDTTQTSMVSATPSSDDTFVENDLISAALLRNNLKKLGYNTTQILSANTKVAIANQPTPELLQWVREGGDLLFFPHSVSPFFWVQGRSGPYSGNWMTSFSWISPTVHPRLADATNPLGLPFEKIMPNNVILGLPIDNAEYQPDILAGLICGWVNHPAVYTVQFRYGKGRVIMTTFAIEKALGSDPVAIAMLNDLVEYLASDKCQPKLTASY